MSGAWTRYGREGGIRTVTSTEAGRHDGDLGLTVLWRPESALLVTEVFGAVEDSSVLDVECDGGHGWGSEEERWRGGLFKEAADGLVSWCCSPKSLPFGPNLRPQIEISSHSPSSSSLPSDLSQLLRPPLSRLACSIAARRNPSCPALLTWFGPHIRSGEITGFWRIP